MDWSVVVMGCLLILLGFGMRRWEQANTRKEASRRQGMPFHSRWLPLLLGVGLIVGKVPKMVGAPFSIVMIADSVNGVLAFTAVVGMVVQAARRVHSRPSAE
ncbi:hypothetical protein ABT300_36855 [Streptomyces sp. NPDC001027]|uniref:hypothetical protein n=1 Tax=Streptomyces sp. NPDC001027 TaxID=3154771 RepID=UPI00332A9A2C